MDDDADAALEKFFEEVRVRDVCLALASFVCEDALLEALQDAPDVEAQAAAFKEPQRAAALLL